MANHVDESYLKGAVSLLAGTVPLLTINMAIYAAFFSAALLWFGLWAGLGILLARFAEAAVIICLVIALATGGWAWRLARPWDRR